MRFSAYERRWSRQSTVCFSLMTDAEPQAEAWDPPRKLFFRHNFTEPKRHSLKHNSKLNLKWKHLLGVCTKWKGERTSDWVTECKGIPAPLTAIYIYKAVVFTYAHNPERVCVFIFVYIHASTVSFQINSWLQSLSEKIESATLSVTDKCLIVIKLSW